MKKFLYTLSFAFVFLIGFYIYSLFVREEIRDHLSSLNRWLGLSIAMCGLLLVLIYLLLNKFKEENN